MTPRRAVTGAVLLDLAVSPLFAWDVFTPTLARELAVTESSLAIVVAVGLASFALGVVVGGRIADAVAPRLLALGTAAGVAAGLLGSAAAQSVAVLVLCFGVVLGVATGLGYATAVRVAGTVASGRGLALGIVVSAYAAGTVVLAPVADALLGLVGRAWTFVIVTGLVAGCLVVAAALVPGQRPSRAPTRPQHARLSSSIRGVVVALWFAFSLGSAPGLAAFAHAGELAHGTVGSATAVQLLSIGNLLGRVVAGPLSDRLGRPVTLHANSGLLVVACVPFAVEAGPTVIVAALLLLGTQYGALSALTPAAAADVVPQHRFGAIYGLIFSGWGVAGLLAPVAAAAFAGSIGLDGIYTGALAVAALSWAGVAAYGRLVHRRTPPGE